MWGTGLQVLPKLQNSEARIATNSNYDSSASALIKCLNQPSIADKTKTEIACMVYESIKCIALNHLQEILYNPLESSLS